MPLPAARYALPHVGSPRGQRSGADPRAHAQVDGLFWCCEFGERKICMQPVRDVRCQNVRDISQVSVTPTHAWQAHGDRPGQRPIPPRQAARALVAAVTQGADPLVFAAVQPAVGANRTRLEAHTMPGYPQPILRHPGQRAHSHEKVLLGVAKIKHSLETFMRHYLSRYV